MSTELDAISLCARVRGFYHGPVPAARIAAVAASMRVFFL